LVPDPSHQVALQRTTSFTWRTALLLPTSHVRLSRRVGALLGQGDEVQQHIQTAVTSAAETVLHTACAGRLNGRDASEYSDLWHTKARARRAKLGDQAGSYDWLDAGDVQQREEVLTHAGFNIGAELAFLIHEQCDLLCNLAYRLFANPIQLSGPRCRIRSRGLDANPAPQRTNDVFVFRIAKQQEGMESVPKTGHIQHHIVAQAAPELEAGTYDRLGLDQWQAFTLFAQ
jgi:hypothetical protein